MNNKHQLLGVPKHANQHRLSRLTMEVHSDELRIVASEVESYTDEFIAALEAAEKRIAELESQRRMSFMACNRWADKFREAESRIAELEAREVVLPQRYSMLHRVYFNEPYHTEMVYKQHQVLEALHDAGVNVAAAAKGEAS